MSYTNQIHKRLNWEDVLQCPENIEDTKCKLLFIKLMIMKNKVKTKIRPVFPLKGSKSPKGFFGRCTKSHLHFLFPNKLNYLNNLIICVVIIYLGFSGYWSQNWVWNGGFSFSVELLWIECKLKIPTLRNLLKNIMSWLCFLCPYFAQISTLVIVFQFGNFGRV